MGKANAFPICKDEVCPVKRIIPLILALLLLPACGEEQQYAAPAEPTPAETVGSTSPSDIPSQNTPPPVEPGESYYANWARSALANLRENEYWDDEHKIRDTVTMYIDLWYDRQYELDCTDYSVFDDFFDTESEGYADLIYHSTEARCLGLMHCSSVFGPVVWHNYDLTIDNLEVDGETARVTVRSLFRELWENYFGMPSGMYTFRIDLRRVDGVWLMTDISPNSIYGDERHGTYDDLLDNIAELEAECVNAAK